MTDTSVYVSFKWIINRKQKKIHSTVSYIIEHSHATKNSQIIGTVRKIIYKYKMITMCSNESSLGTVITENNDNDNQCLYFRKLIVFSTLILYIYFKIYLQ